MTYPFVFRSFFTLLAVTFWLQLFIPVTAEAQQTANFATSGTLGNLRTSTFIDPTTDIEVKGWYLNLMGGTSWQPANLYRRNQSNDHGFGVCNPDEEAAGGGDCPGPAGGGDVNELDNMGQSELISLKLPEGFEWVSVRVSSLDTNPASSDPAERGQLWKDEDGVFNSTTPGMVGDEVIRTFTGGVDPVEPTFVFGDHIAQEHSRSPFLVFEPFDHSGDGNTNNDYLVYQATIRQLPTQASLGDRVWEDRNADGIQDCSDDNNDGILGNQGDLGAECNTGIGGVTVQLLTPGPDNTCNTGDDIDTFLSSQTNASGFYGFTDLDTNQEYCLKFDRTSVNQQLQCDAQLGGLSASPQNQGSDDVIDSDADEETGVTDNIKLVPGDDDKTWDAGFFCLSKLGDRLIDDQNENGIQEVNEPGVPGQTVELFDCVNGAPGTVIGSTTTDSDGIYMFSGLAPGEYAVRFAAPTGFVFSPQNLADEANDCDADPGTGLTACVTLGPNENNPNVDACVNEPVSGGLGDRVWEDLDADGIQDGNEPGIPNVPVALFDPGDDGSCDLADLFNEIDTTSTDSNGNYQFNGLAAGQYCIAFGKSALQCDFGDPAFSPQNQGSDDAIDSDADELLGLTGIINLAEGEFDPTWDAGIYCPAKLGDQVWDDLNSDGLQNNLNQSGGEPGISGQTVKLLDCAGNSIADLDGMTEMVTDSQGMYMFRVTPGQYIIEFETPLDKVFTDPNVGSDDTIDSDVNPVSGRTACITVPSNTFDRTWDAGLTTPPDCGIAVDKICEIVEPEPEPFVCDDKIDSMTMVWDGSMGTLQSVTAHLGDPSKPTLPVSIDGNVVTVSGYQTGGAPNDVVWVYTATDGSGQSEFHLSCSDKDMNGEDDNDVQPQVSPLGQDCGKSEGNGKDNSSGDNVWLLEGLKTDKGFALNCTPPEPVLADACEFQAQIASCETLPNDPEILSFKYTGGGCAASDNSQKPSDATCSGQIDSVSAVTAFFGNQSVTVEPGQLFDVPRSDADKITLQNSGGSEFLELHTSCSQPLETGDVYGSLTLVALDGVGLGRDVRYSYEIANMGIAKITDITVQDDLLGEIPGSPIASLSPGNSMTLTQTTFVDLTTTNKVTVEGKGTPGAACTAMDTVTVTVLDPPPCSVRVQFDKIEDDKIKYKLTNTGNRVARMETFVLNFDSGYGFIKEVKLDGGVFKDDKSPLQIGPGVTIGANNWTEPDVTKRQLDPGETRTLEIVFKQKQDKELFTVDDFSGAVTFKQGCSVSL